MAVYKPTLCYPFLNSFDPRLVATNTNGLPTEWLKCKIETSNKNVTGYKVKVLDQDNEVVFEGSEVSPISELQKAVYDSNTNTGVNGTYLNIPFFQLMNEGNRYYKSYNSIYFQANRAAHYLLGVGKDFVKQDNIENWTYENETLSCDNWDGKINGEIVATGEIVCAIRDTTDPRKVGLWYIDEDQVLKRYNNVGYSELSSSITIILKGQFDNYYVYDEDIFQYSTRPNKTPFVAFNKDGSLKAVDISTNGRLYKWIIYLYQGDGKVVGTDLLYINYDNISNNWWDMKLSTGKILGSTPERIQISALDRDLLPTNQEGNFVILQTRYLQLLDDNNNFVGSRTYVNSYDSLYGHVYPKAGSLDATVVTSNKVTRCQFFKHSNNPNEIEAGDVVICATTDNIALDGTVTVVDGYKIAENNRVLVKNQDTPQENGIYEAHIGASWKRASTYDTWGEFIGSLIYVSNGQTNGGKNFEPLANAGGQLWNDEDNKESFTPLTFIEEQPILLFPELLDLTVDYIVEDIRTIQTTVDGEYPSIGDTVINIADNSVYTITYIDSSKHITFAKSSQTLTNIKYVYVSAGTSKQYSHRVIDVQSNYQITQDLSVARILKNTSTKTYISPYSDLSVGHKLKILSTGEWINIQGVNKTLWYIVHEEHIPFDSYNAQDKRIPYTYEVRSYFNISDENPFYLYERPYLRIGHNGNVLPISEAYEYFKVADEEFQFLYSLIDEAADPSQDSSYEPFLVKTILRNAIKGRYISLEGFYTQEQQASWESYRWLLADKNYNILQDTGSKYDKEMKVTFYGLANDQTEAKTYYAILYVTDELGNLLINVFEFVVTSAETSSYNVNFKAEFSCLNQSVQLTYDGNVSIYPSIDLNNNYQVSAYVEQNDSIKLNWDNSLQYVSSSMMISGKDGSNANQMPTNEQNNESYSVINGVTYDHYYLSGIYTQDKSSRFLNIETDSDNNTNDFYFYTQIHLTDDFCGDVLRIDLTELNEQDDSEMDDTYQLVIRTTENIKDGKLAADRGRLVLAIQKNGIDHIVDNNNGMIYNWLGIENNIYSNVMYKIQPKGTHVNKSYLFLDNLIKTKSLYFIENNGSFINSKYDLGCLGLVQSGAANGRAGTISYWNDERPLTRLITRIGLLEESTRNFKELDNNQEQEQYWPENDSVWYWAEHGKEGQLQKEPEKWGNIGVNGLVDGSNFQYYESVDRYYGLYELDVTPKAYNIQIIIRDLDGIKNVTTFVRENISDEIIIIKMQNGNELIGQVVVNLESNPYKPSVLCSENTICSENLACSDD